MVMALDLEATVWDQEVTGLAQVAMVLGLVGMELDLEALEAEGLAGVLELLGL